MVKANSELSVPVDFKVFKDLHDKINAGSLKADTLLPSEKELSEEYSTDVNIIQKAILELMNEGLVRSSAEGYVIEPIILERPPSCISSFFDEVQKAGLKPSSVVNGISVIPSTHKQKKILNLEQGELIVKVSRIRMIGDEPVALQTNYVPYRLCAGLEKEDLALVSFQGLLEKKYNIVLFHANERIQAEVVSASHGRLLNVEPGSAILKIERIAFMEDNTPAVIAILRFPGGRYVYTSTLTR